MKKQVLKRTIAIALALILALGNFAMPILAAEEEGVVIKLHYNRPDGNYTDWSVWFWNFGQEGTDIPFADEEGEKVATFPVASGVTQVGFIVKLPNWAAKDVAEDQFIDVAAYTSGTIHVYVESGVKGYTIKLGDDVKSGIKLTKAVYDEKAGIRVSLTASIGDGADAFTVMGPDGQVEITGVALSVSTYTLTPAAPLNLYESYTLIFDGEEYPITMPNVYSTETFEADFTYEGDDLGAVWTAEKTSFRVWAPTATEVMLNLYKSGTAGTDDLIESIPMTASDKGTWVAEKSGDLNGTYYTYSVTTKDGTNEACDPYARTTGVNGQRAMVIDLDSTDPAGWENDTDPHAGANITDAVIYELHVRDLSVDESSGITNKGKYLGLIETGTTNAAGVATGLDHIKDLGITHLHLLPVYDYGSVDESKLDTPQFNWGYDPVNYNVPEGSYSTDPYDGAVRVAEFKQMVKGLHDNGISVIMDVEYNHVHSAGDFCFNKIVPGYFSRISDSGSYTNGSGSGNDTASERSMVSKYIVDSVKYWADEYHIDGFRFDQVGLIDPDTINKVIEEVHKTHPNVIFYGEGWTMGTQLTKNGYDMTTQSNSAKAPEFSFFSDTIRDALKGSVFNNAEPGYASGASGKTALIENCFLGQPGWTKNPTQNINYASCHDNLSLFDKLALSNPNDSVADRIKMNNLAAAIYMTAQGTPFMQAGEEMLRSKPLATGGFDHNSYSSPDSVNSLKWDNLNDEAYQSVYNYYKGLIAFRKAHPALRMTTTDAVNANITVMKDLDTNVTAFQIKGGANGDTTEGIIVIFNPNKTVATVALPEGNWNVYINGETAGTTALGSYQGQVKVAPISAMVLLLENDTVLPTPADPTEATVAPTEAPTEASTVPATTAPTTESPAQPGFLLPLFACLIIIGVGAYVVISGKKK